MLIPNWLVIGAAELFALLLLICAFFVVHTNKLKTFTSGLQKKIQELLTDLKQTKQAYNEMQDLISEESSYSDILDEQLNQTREYHLSLNPDQDITLDLDPSSPMPRQIASLRYAFLISEKEASLTSEDGKNANWMVIQSKLANIIGFFSSNNESIKTFEEDADPVADLQDALATTQQEMSDIKGQFSNIQMETQSYHDELSNIAVAEHDQEKFNDLLERYQAALSGLGNTESGPAYQARSTTNTVEVVRDAPRDNSELDALRGLTSEQHSLINQLQQRLRQAQTPEEKTSLINDLSEQLEQQKRFMKESEMCIQLMDNELDDANSKIHELESTLARQSSKSGSARENDLTEELNKQAELIKRLEQENQQLVMQLDMG
jgi:hypothetical protein